MDIPNELVEAKRLVELDVLALAGVVGIGLGQREQEDEVTDELVVKILVTDASQVPEGLPQQVGGVAVQIVERDIVPCSFPEPPTRYDNLRGGVQITQPLRGSGTLGCLVEDASTGDTLGLTCQHVVGDPGSAFPDNVWQPTNPPLIASTTISAQDNLGDVLRSDFPQTAPLPGSPIRVGVTDAAVVLVTGAVAAGRTLSQGVAGLDSTAANLVDAVSATGVAEPVTATARVRKRGFITGPKSGTVILRFATLNWKPGGPNAFLMEQAEILADPNDIFCNEGDSGSLVLAETNPTAVGLLWGCNDATSFVPAGRFAYMSEISNVEAQLGISVVFA